MTRRGEQLAQNQGMTAWIAIATGIVATTGLYLAFGLAFALVLTLLPAPAALLRVDPGAQGMTLAARLLIVPGLAVLWPLMLARWLRRSTPPVA